MMRSWAGALLALALPGVAQAHVGSPDVLYEGPAGPYGVLVRVRPPDVVPGTAEVTLRVDRDVRRVTLRPLYFHTGKDGAPRADEARPVPGDPRLFSGQVWLMEFGSSSVALSIEGPSGPGEVVVPVPALATSRRVLEPYLGFLLAGLGLVLVGGAVAVMGAASRESALPAGSEAGPGERGRARNVMLVTTVLLIALLAVGRRWWGIVDRAYVSSMYKPPELLTSVVTEGGWRVLRLTLQPPSPAEGDEPSGFRAPAFSSEPTTTPLVPDHGKLMHLFLVGEPSLQPFAHLHPVSHDALSFASVLPGLSAGRYRVFADVVHEDGFAETLTAGLDLTAPAGAPADTPPPLTPDPDDSWSAAAPSGPSQRLEDGSTMAFVSSSAAFQAGRLDSLRFSVSAPDGSPAALEPYMGMLAHAAVVREDGSVFVHLHPVGTVPMASQQAFARRVGEAGAMDHAAHAGAASVVSFPYAFPRPGRYRLFVQVKRGGRVLTGSFDASVR